MSTETVDYVLLERPADSYGGSIMATALSYREGNDVDLSFLLSWKYSHFWLPPALMLNKVAAEV